MPGKRPRTLPRSIARQGAGFHLVPELHGRIAETQHGKYPPARRPVVVQDGCVADKVPSPDSKGLGVQAHRVGGVLRALDGGGRSPVRDETGRWDVIPRERLPGADRDALSAHAAAYVVDTHGLPAHPHAVLVADADARAASPAPSPRPPVDRAAISDKTSATVGKIFEGVVVYNVPSR